MRMKRNITFMRSSPRTCRFLFTEFKRENRGAFGKKIFFEGVDEKDVYNITAPFFADGVTYIAGRVEERTANWQQEEYQTATIFFVARGNAWVPAEGLPIFSVEDPFLVRFGRDIIFGGVEVFSPFQNKTPRSFRTVFYRGTTIGGLRKFAVGPDHMKDIRLVELEHGQIGVFTRHQGHIGGRGTIGFMILDALDELSSVDLMNASLLEKQFMRLEWGGVNEARKLPDGRIGVVGHIASRDTQGNKSYYVMTFTLCPYMAKVSPLRIIAARNNFPSGPTKMPELANVVFPGGFTMNNDGTITLYAGLSDTEAGCIVCHEPFTST